MQTYKIGTRGSLLAVTQSTLMKNQLEKISGDKFELVLIKTQGDEVTNKPLWQLEGKDFFTKELDEALLKGEVDLVIHSYKDLGSIRPAGIKLAAVTERKFAHDILLIPQAIVDQLPSWKGELKVGTSSPRRIANLTHSLKKYLPIAQDSSLVCETLRGNVNSRIKKLKDGQYHAIVLALAGLERLASAEKSAAELKGLIEGLNFFILPQSLFPTAASQGALGLEVRDDRDDNGKLEKLVNQLAHEVTVEEVFRERKAFKEFGGGCHLAVGLHVKKIGEHFLHVHSGEVDGKRIEKKWLEGIKLSKVAAGKKLFVGLPHGSISSIVYDELIEKEPETKNLDFTNSHVFVTSRYCLPTIKASARSARTTLWAAGSKTAEQMAKNGLWVNGSADSLGTSELKSFRHSLVMQMFHSDLNSQWKVLTHPESQSDLGETIGTYQRKVKSVSAEYKNKLQSVGACFWTSFPQYQTFISVFPHLKDVAHYCGLGKTWEEFKNKNIQITPVASMQEFYDLGDV